MLDQPMPTPNNRPAVFMKAISATACRLRSGDRERVADALTERARIGRERYGVDLQAHNGRDVRRDLLEELLDALMYAAQWHDEALDAHDVAAETMACEVFDAVTPLVARMIRP